MQQIDPQLKCEFAARLKAAGWKLVDDTSMKATTAIATKTYLTYVGPKEAIAYLMPLGDGGAVLSGQYWSEGRDVLSSNWFVYRPEMRSDDIEVAVAAWALETDRRVSDTYAMRLVG